MRIQKRLFIILFFSIISVTSASDFAKSHNSINGGVNFVIGDYAASYLPGFNIGANFMFRPIKYLAFGFSPDYTRWAIDVGRNVDYSGAYHAFALYPGIRPIVPLNDDFSFFFQLGTGANITIAVAKNSYTSDTHGEVYWGMNYAFGFIFKKLEVSMKSGFMRDFEWDDNFPSMGFNVGFAW